MTDFIEQTEPCVRGHIAPRYKKFGGCVLCVQEDNKVQREKNLKSRADYQRAWKKKNRVYSNGQRRDWSRKNPEKTMLVRARTSPKTRGLPFNLTIEDIEIPNYCPVLGIKLEPGEGERTDNSPSLDRINPKKGYVKGNVVVVSWRANRLKQDASVKELVALANFYSGKD